MRFRLPVRAVALVCATTAAQAAASVTDVTVYRGGLVWTGHGFKARDLAVRDGRFVAIRRGLRPKRVVQLRGRFVVPAYANAHAHLTSPTDRQSRQYLEAGVFYVWNPNTVVMGPEAKSFYQRRDTFDVAVAQGGITEPGGHPEKLYVDVLSKFVYQGKTLPDFLGNAFHYGRTQAEIDAALDRLKSQRADFVKAYLLNSEEYAQRRDDPKSYGLKGLNPANMPYLVRAARKRGLAVAVHVETAHDLRIAAESRAAFAAHLPGYWSVKTRIDLARRTLTPSDAAAVARSGMLLVPTYAVANREDVGSPAQTEVSRSEVLEVQARNIRLLREAGARFVVGTDGSGPIFDEVEHLVKIGSMGAAEAARMVFGTGRKLFPKRRIGCFRLGCEADFLVLADDPRRDVRALRSIIMAVKAGQTLQRGTGEPTKTSAASPSATI